MKKRLLASLLSLCLLVGLFPTAALAAEDTADEAAVCTVTEGCTLEAGHDGECILPDEPETQEDDLNSYYEFEDVYGVDDDTVVISTIQERINDLPGADALAEMGAEEQAKVYAEVCAIYAAIDELTAEEAEALDVSALEETAVFFSQQIMLLEGEEEAPNVLSGGTKDLSESAFTGTLTVTGDAEIANGTITGTVIVKSGVTLTIRNVTVTGQDGAGIKADGKNVTLIVAGTNSVTGADGYAGVQVGPEASLTIQGDGTLTAAGTGNGAGIGGSGSDGVINGDITVNMENGTLIAKSGTGGGAGIGAASTGGNGSYESSGDITIIAGKIDATSLEDGAGIGSAHHVTSGTITIEGGEITATGGSGGAGIGAGYGSSSASGKYYATVVISGGTINATGGWLASGIGGGYGSGAYVTITGGDITAQGGNGNEGTTYQGGSGIGGGYQANAKVEISGGTIDATGGNSSPGIGNGPVTGKSGVQDNQAISGEDSGIVITGGSVTAQGGCNAAGIGGGNCTPYVNVEISGEDTVINATGGTDAPGIGSGVSADSSKTTYNAATETSVQISNETIENITAAAGESTSGNSEDKIPAIGAALNNSEVAGTEITNPDGTTSTVYGSQAEGKYYTFVFSVSPEGAVISVRNADGAEMSKGEESYFLPAGNYAYTVNADGYNGKSGSITSPVNSADSQTISVTLQKPESSAVLVTSGDGVNTYYDTLSGALSAAEKGSTIKLLGDITATETVNLNKENLTLDLNGHTLTASPVSGDGITVNQSGCIITSSSADKGTISYNGSGNVIYVNATLSELSNVCINGAGNAARGIYIYGATRSVTLIKDCTIENVGIGVDTYKVNPASNATPAIGSIQSTVIDASSEGICLYMSVCQEIKDSTITGGTNGITVKGNTGDGGYTTSVNVQDSDVKGTTDYGVSVTDLSWGYGSGSVTAAVTGGSLDGGKGAAYSNGLANSANVTLSFKAEDAGLACYVETDKGNNTAGKQTYYNTLSEAAKNAPGGAEIILIDDITLDSSEDDTITIPNSVTLDDEHKITMTPGKTIVSVGKDIKEFLVAPGGYRLNVDTATDDSGVVTYTYSLGVIVTDVTLDKNSLELYVGGTADLTATVSPEDASNKSVIWSSSNTNVATVDNNGTVKAIAEGTATITVKTADGEKTASCTVTVTKKSTGGGGGSSSSTYTVTVDSAKNGTVKADRTNASKGTTVTLTVTPKDGYGLDSLTVTDKNGDTVKLTRKSDTQYTFTMPASKVTVEASFTKIAEQSKVSFVDVPTSAYYYDAVAWAVENGVTAGTSATTFSPDAACTRAQAVTFLWRAAGSPAPKSSVNPFADVPASAYYYDAVLWAVEQGITAGTSATTFSPDATCTRGQIVTFLYRADGTATTSNNPFTDVADSAYYVDAVKWAVAEGVTAGTSATTFSPDASCTRAQIVTFLYRAYA